MSDAFAILPREMWDNIGTFLPDDDWENFTNSCQAFYDLFQGKRVQKLFGKVMRALLKTPNEVHPYIKMDELLTWRFVCKPWNKAITYYMAANSWQFDVVPCSTIYAEEFSFTTSRNNEEEKHFPSWMDDRIFVISNTTEVQKKYEIMLTSHPLPKDNPILSRSVFFDDTFAEDPAQHVQVGDQLLSSYGSHVKSICFKFTRTYEEMSVYAQIYDFLCTVPNIKYLSIEFGDAHIPSNPEEMAELITEVGATSLMRLDHLITFVTEGLPYPIFNEVLRSNPHIQRLMIDDQVASPEIENYRLCPLPNLKILAVNIRSPKYMTLLENTPGRWPLKMLQLYMKIPDRQSDCYGLARLSRMIESKVFPTTLTELELQLPSALSWRVQLLEESLNDRLHLPCVKNLNLFGISPYSLDFILPMADSLQHLVIAFPALDSVAYLCNVLAERPLKQEVIQFLAGYTSSMEESNIWSLFPQLKDVRTLALQSMPAVDPFGPATPTNLFVEPCKYIRKNGIVHKRRLAPYTVDWN